MVSFRLLLAGVLTATVSCTSSTAPLIASEIGIIQHYGSSTDDVLVVPATAAAGRDFEVSVRSFGGGCSSAAGIGVRYVGDTAIVTPYVNDRARAPASTACFDVLVRLTHTAVLRFPNPGTAVVRVEGRREPEGTAARIETTIGITG